MNNFSYEDIVVGLTESFDVVVDEDMMRSFRDLTSDYNPLHSDREYAMENGYEDRVVYGFLTASFLSTLAGVYLPGEKSLIHSVQIDFPKPTYIGQRLRVVGEVVEKIELYKSFIMKVAIYNDKNEKVCRGKMQIGVI